MQFTYQAITANCGNNDFGPVATNSLCHYIRIYECDFYLINLQEANYNQIEQALKSQLLPPYSVMKCACMDTITNLGGLSSRISGQPVGIANLIIYDSEKIEITVQNTQEIRRFNLRNKDSEFLGYNKGGINTTLTLQSKTDPIESIKIQMISGHLDSNYPDKRAIDWHNIQKMTSMNVTEDTTWDDLVLMLPDLRVSGIDCNTRDLISSYESPIWTQDHEEIQGFNQFPLGNLRYSSTDTYVPKDDPKKLIKEARYAAQGYTLSGSLDVNEILNYKPPTFAEFDIESSITLDPDENHPRDHKIIITPVLSIEKLDDFEHVKTHLCILLKNAAPTLARQILTLGDSPDERDTLLKTFKLLIGQEGFLFELHELFQNKLEFIRKLKDDKRAPIVIEDYRKTLFSQLPWLNDFRLATMEEQIEEKKIEITALKQILENPPVVRSFDELKKDCCEALESYKEAKSLSISSLIFSKSIQGTKKAAVSNLIEEIKICATPEAIKEAISRIRSDKTLFVNSSETESVGVLSQKIKEAENILNNSIVLMFKEEAQLSDLKTWLIAKLDSYSTLPKDNATRNAASIEGKINACHQMIDIINECCSTQEILTAMILYKKNNPALFKKASGKFFSIVEECIEMTAHILESEQSPELKRK